MRGFLPNKLKILRSRTSSHHTTSRFIEKHVSHIFLTLANERFHHAPHVVLGKVTPVDLRHGELENLIQGELDHERDSPLLARL